MSERDEEVAWIERRERGEVSDHPRAAVYARLGQAIATLPELDGGGAWRAAVLDELDRDDELRRARAARVRRTRIAAALVASLAVAALVVVVVVRPRPVAAVATELGYEIGDAAGPRRAVGAVTIGQPLTIRARFAGAGELWIYRGDRLLVRCPGGAGCSLQPIPGGRQVTALVQTDVALTYTALLVLGAPGQVPSPAGTLQADADRAGAAIEQTLTIDVR